MRSAGTSSFFLKTTPFSTVSFSTLPCTSRTTSDTFGLLISASPRSPLVASTSIPGWTLLSLDLRFLGTVPASPAWPYPAAFISYCGFVRILARKQRVGCVSLNPAREYRAKPALILSAVPRGTRISPAYACVPRDYAEIAANHPHSGCFSVPSANSSPSPASYPVLKSTSPAPLLRSTAHYPVL